MVIREKTWKIALIFSLIWTLTLLYGEMFVFWIPLYWSYSWPHLSLRSGGGQPNDFVKVAVLTDPQLMDRTSHDFPPKSLVLEIAQFYSDLYMRRAFHSTILPFEPDVILFLGDYFDGGPELSNDEWQESLSRFKHIFDIENQGRDIPVYYIPGNHDIGYAWHFNRKPEILERYENTFRARNHKFTVGKVDFIAVDAQTVDGNSKDNSTSRTWDFVNNIPTGVGTNPRVLLTHIPLYRPDWTSCGPYRSSEVINQRIARSAYDGRIRYQNYVAEESSKRLLDIIKPELVLSGHDHDQCTVTHETKSGTVEEHTVGTLSWQQGNWYPSFMLLSVGNSAPSNGSSPESVILSQLCFLPTQLFIYIWYIILFVITIFVLLFWPAHGMNIGQRFSHLVTSLYNFFCKDIFASGLKEKNEDDNFEYEMVWDAEGGMHLVRKLRMVPSASSKDTGSIERGNAVMRATRRQMVQEQEGSAKVDIDSNSASTAKISLKSTKTFARILLQRCLRVLVAIFIIAVVNVPLYMMLLFKDWIA